MRAFIRLSAVLQIHYAMGSRGSVQPDIFAASPNPTAAVIFLHGLGDTSQGWTPVFRPMSPKLPHVRFILPTAPTRPVTLNMGMRMPAWFDIIALSKAGPEDSEGIKATAAYVQTLMDEQIKAGIPADRIIVGGFSQGAAISYYVGLTAPTKPAGIMPLSGWAPLYTELSADPALPAACSAAPLTIFAGHGTHDSLVQFAFGKASYDNVAALFTRGSGRHEFHSYPMEHSVTDSEIADMARWLSVMLPPQ